MSQLRQLQFDALRRAQADEVLSTIPMIAQEAEDPSGGGELENAILQGLNALTAGTDGRMGLAVVFLLPKFGSALPNLPGPYFDSATLFIIVVEDRVFNLDTNGYAPAGVGLRGDDVAKRIAQIFQHWRDGGISAGTFVVRNCNPMDMLNAPEEIAKRIRDRGMGWWSIVIEGKLQMDQLTKCGLVQIAFSTVLGHQVATLTCPATSGVSMKYSSTDGSTFPAYPATAYATPVAALSGTQIRAVASKSGLIDSDVTFAIAP